MTFKVTPWEVKGNVDYDKLVKEFGVSVIDDKLLKEIQSVTKDLHFMLRRKVFAYHRDLDKIIREFKKGNKFYLYTGRGPSGDLHLGHIMPWLFVKWLQEKFDAELYFQITDDEKFLFKDKSWEEIEEYTKDNIIDIISLGFKKEKTKFIIDTKDIKTLYPIAIKIAKKINFSTVKAVFGFTNESNIGQIFYTALQTVPSVLKSVEEKKNVYCLIPHGIDQDPHFRVGRDVLPKLGFLKPASIQCKMLPSLKGLEKSSSSSDDSIFLKDDEKTVKRKIARALTGGQDTVENQRKYGGNPDKCNVFRYYEYLFEPDDEELEKIRQECKAGRRLCGECKLELTKRINSFLKELKNNRTEAEKHWKEWLYSKN